jgi:hypothetical protein
MDLGTSTSSLEGKEMSLKCMALPSALQKIPFFLIAFLLLLVTPEESGTRDLIRPRGTEMRKGEGSGRGQ